MDDDRLIIEASERNIGQRLHSPVQKAMLAVNDMFVLAQPRVATFFWEAGRANFSLISTMFDIVLVLSWRGGPATITGSISSYRNQWLGLNAL